MAQNKQDWDELGRSIEDIVDRAVNSRDFRKLSQTISRTVGAVLDEFNQQPVTTNAPPKPAPPRKSADTAARTKQEIALLYGSATGKTVGGILKIVGGGLLECAAVGAFIVSLIPSFGGPALWLALGFACGGAVLLANGISNVGWASRFKAYRKLLGQKTHISLETLARNVGKTVNFVRKEVLRMTNAGLFREGHLNKEETMFITSHETYRYFEQSRLKLEERKRLEVAEQEQKRKNAPAPHVQEVIDRGDAFVAQIRQCNDRIPGEEISAKISRMEAIVDKIFDRAETHPEIIPDLKKLMDYYLPMTVKLLNAYADMDAQPVQGQNIQASKQEIEATLDTLNLAFEKLLDKIFEDTAMDVSSDISVLNTLLAQEGLTEDELTRLNKR
ncbi:MAG: 5-bromo-4-chloroindolyl phosphate hydrolysis family protein [Oscillospiraceae bacterium]|nr:5-bromo-4-chloroindolyl phosphate hydrolysis family protein [Oscillospiraceae bacterium]